MLQLNRTIKNKKMKKFSILLLFVFVFCSCGKRQYEKLYAETIFIADPGQTIHWEKHGNKLFPTVTGCLYSERDTMKPIPGMQNISVSIEKYRSEEQLVFFWKETETGSRHPVNCIVWQYKNRVAIGLE